MLVKSHRDGECCRVQLAGFQERQEELATFPLFLLGTFILCRFFFFWSPTRKVADEMKRLKRITETGEEGNKLVKERKECWAKEKNEWYTRTNWSSGGISLGKREERDEWKNDDAFPPKGGGATMDRRTDSLRDKDLSRVRERERALHHLKCASIRTDQKLSMILRPFLCSL